MGSSCYDEHTRESITWEQAEGYCNHRGGHLWSINSFEEFYRIYRRKSRSVSNSSIKPMSFDPDSSEHSFIGLREDKVDIHISIIECDIQCNYM